jgi:glycyl-tRNA synthetase
MLWFRYARTDEIGIPFGVTVDLKSAEDKMATIRERDSTLQIRVPMEIIPQMISDLSTNRLTWADCVKEHGLVAEAKAE